MFHWNYLKVSLKLLSEAAAHRFSVKRAVLKIFSKFKRKHLCQRFFNEFEQNTNEDWAERTIQHRQKYVYV